MIYDDLCSEFAEIVVFKAIPSFTDVRIGHLSSSSSNANAWSTALCTKWNTINPVGKCGKGFLSSGKDHTFKCSQLEPKLDSLYCFGHFRCWVSLVCRQHGQQQTLWFALKNHNGGSGTRFRGPKGGTVQELQETSDFKGQDFVAWPRWRLNHLARVLPIMMQNVKLSATGVTMPENMSPWPIVGYSLPRVYPAAHHSKSQEVRNHSKIVNFEQKHSWINLCCNHESVGKTCDWKLRSLSYLKLMHNSEMYRNVRKLQHWQVYVPSQHSGPLPDSEFSTGPCEVNGIGVPALRARTRATKVEMEFCCASWLTCCAGVCIPYKGRKGAKVQTKEQVTWHSTWTKMPKMPMVLMRSEWFMMIYAVSLLRL